MVARRLCIVIVVALTVPAHAGKPTDKQAKQAAIEWIAAMQFKDESAKPDGAVHLTSTPFYAIAYDDNGAPCAETTSTSPTALTKTLACLHLHVRPDGSPKMWTKKSKMRLSGPLLSHAKKIAALGKTAALVEVMAGCDGMESWVVLAIATDAKKSAHVTAVLAQNVTCSE